jgi:glutathione peroxidase
MFVKGPVSGQAAQPLYTDLRRLTGQGPRWNFHKYLISRDGRSVRSYISSVTPQSDELTRQIEQWLAAR